MGPYRGFQLGRFRAHLKRSPKIVIGIFGTVGVAVGLIGPTPALAADSDGLNAVPFEFVGKVGDCGPGYPAGSGIVTAAWLRGMGLPDNGGLNSNPSDPTDNPNKKDPHFGLLLSKNGPTPDCSSSGARITGVEGMIVGPGFELGFDYRNGTHCGAGAARFNVMATDGFHFVGGCANATPSNRTPAPQDPTQWTRVRFDTSDAFPPLSVGSEIQSISILYDEGTDATSAPDDPNGVGLTVLDNIDVDGMLITRGPEGGD